MAAMFPPSGLVGDAGDGVLSCLWRIPLVGENADEKVGERE
jgi:hypothetical protein